jgi:hypothetical protein
MLNISSAIKVAELEVDAADAVRGYGEEDRYFRTP